MKVLIFMGLYSIATVGWCQVSLTEISNSTFIDFSSATPATVGTTPGSAYSGFGFSPDPTTAGRLNSNAWAVTGQPSGSLAFGGTQTNNEYARGPTAIAITAGGFYAYTSAPASASNPTFMVQPTGSSFISGTLTLRIKNDGASSITSFDVSYNLFIRNDGPRSNSFNISYSTDNMTYTPVSALDYSSPAASDFLGWGLVGTSPSRTTSISSLSVPPGGFIYLRWSSSDVSGSGNRDEFGLDDISLNATFQPLPIQLVSFKAYQKHNQVNISWSTASQLNVDRFIVERASSNAEFNSIGSIIGEGNSLVLMRYAFVDEHPYSGINYYRLKSVDLDGSFEYSSMILVDAQLEKKIRVFPNPSDGLSINIVAAGEGAQDGEIEIYNAMGILQNKPNLPAEGKVNFDEKLPAGLYLLRYHSDQIIQTARFIVE